MPEGPATVLGGLPVWAEVWFSRGDGWTTDDDAGVDQLYWLKRDGTKGKPLSQKIMDRIEKEDYWECDVIDKVSDYLAHEQWIAEHGDVEPEPFKFDTGSAPDPEVGSRTATDDA